MVHAKFSTVLILLSAVRMATAVQPLRLGSMIRPVDLVKRQDLCVGPVICEQTETTCRSCEAGFYCVPGGGCCEEGQVCAGFKPCVNAGTPAPTETQICPTEAPLCTSTDGVPVCSGSIQDWITISEALAGSASTTTVPTSSTEVPLTSIADPTTSSLPTEPTTDAAPTTEIMSVPTYVPPPSETTAYAPPPAHNTTTSVPPPVATGAGVKNSLELGTIAGFIIFAVSLL